MPYSCVVQKCKGNYKNGPKVSVFRFPKSEEMKRKWINSIKRDSYQVNSHSRVCELHFVEEDIVRQASFFDERTGRLLTAPIKFPRLREGAVPLVAHLDSEKGQPSKNPSDPDYVPSVFDTSSKNTSPRKTSTTPPADDTESDKTTQVWTSLLQLQPITSEAGTSGLSEPSAQNQKPEEPEKPSTKAAVTGIWKSKTKPKPKPRPRKRPRTPSPPPAESKIIDPLKLCVVKMEIEDDGYNQNEEESFLASLTPSSSQTSHNDTLSFDSASSIKTEPNQEPTIYKLVPTISESAPTNSTQQDVEVFFKNVAQTVMQLPLHLIEETKTKVSALVYEMVIQAMREGSTNITQHKL
ncbi:uncharacterized protein [Parasteatoda tepidariorum]|uniref:uncharacterized protein isoform X9 n=1 Tax=Parasteatoda tepidariorum TaxID=114398 RepID=UPI001C723202|nr:uncharacterized protein LOC107443779 isoform X8 [Parasteatoda tepidariorum]